MAGPSDGVQELSSRSVLDWRDGSAGKGACCHGKSKMPQVPKWQQWVVDHEITAGHKGSWPQAGSHVAGKR